MTFFIFYIDFSRFDLTHITTDYSGMSLAPVNNVVLLFSNTLQWSFKTNRFSWEPKENKSWRMFECLKEVLSALSECLQSIRSDVNLESGPLEFCPVAGSGGSVSGCKDPLVDSRGPSVDGSSL